MSKSHAKYLPIIRDHWEAANVTTFIEPSFGPKGERPDTLGLVERGIDGLWGDVELYPGTLIVSDYKHSVADLRHDELKVWRHTSGIGDYRFYWLLKDGDVRPEHVNEDSWWGVVMFDAAGWEVVREPRGFKQTRKLTERLLLWRLALDAGRDRMQGHGSPARSPSRAVRQPQGVPKLAKAIAEWMGETPATTGECKRFLRSVGDERSPRQIEKFMRDSGLFIPPECDGGVWQVKTNAAESA
jgi:hypothetical protein